MFASVTGDECGTSRRSVDARRSGAAWGSSGRVVGVRTLGREEDVRKGLAEK